MHADRTPDADPLDLLDAFLRAHAQEGLPGVLALHGDALLRRYESAPPRDARWGRFLVALGQVLSEQGDDDRASRCFLMALRDAAALGDHETAVTAGYDQGVLQERRGRALLALAAYRTAAREGFRLGDASANLLRCALRAVELAYAEAGQLGDDDLRLAKQAWLLWLWIEGHARERLDEPLRSDAQRLLCALLLPEDPTDLAAAWRFLPPAALAAPAIDGNDPRVIAGLFALAADAADRHLAGDGGGDAYRHLAAAARRCG